MNLPRYLTIILIIGALTLIAITKPAQANPITYPNLPTDTIFDSVYHRTAPITQYTYDQLDQMMGTPLFRRWNDMDKVCASMQIIFGHVSSSCAGYTPYPIITTVISPVTARAYVGFTIIPPPAPPTYDYAISGNPTILPPRPIMIVDPVYPPWSPTYNPYW